LLKERANQASLNLRANYNNSKPIE